MDLMRAWQNLATCKSILKKTQHFIVDTGNDKDYSRLVGFLLAGLLVRQLYFSVKKLHENTS